jgi:small-conductance mechanosensitive channel
VPGSFPYLHLADIASVLLIWLGAAIIARVVVLRFVASLARRTRFKLDNDIVDALRRPIFWTLIFIGVALAYHTWRREPPEGKTLLSQILVTLAIWFWMKALMRVSDIILDALARRAHDHTWIEPRSLPLYEISAKLVVVGAAVYAVMATWEINVSAWLASAGIVGIAVGFAARDTLANLFAGIFILADAPYKLGDFIVLDSGERGRVTDIGIRSTRLLTRDDIEITLPNAVIANAKITNETGGPYKKTRVRVAVGVAYGSDVDHVREVLTAVLAECEYVEQYPEPQVRFRTMGDSALVFQVRGWVAEPVLVGRTIDALNTAIYKRFAESGIEIPFPQRVVHLRKED